MQPSILSPAAGQRSDNLCPLLACWTVASIIPPLPSGILQRANDHCSPKTCRSLQIAIEEGRITTQTGLYVAGADGHPIMGQRNTLNFIGSSGAKSKGLRTYW